MKFILITLAISGMAVTTGFPADYSKEDIARMEAGLERWRDLSSRAGTMPPEEAIPELGKGIYKTTLTSIYVHGDREGVKRLLQETLLSIPGHAEYYGAEIRRIMDNKVSGKETGGDMERMWAFRILEQLPSPETVKVLGTLLYDDRDPWAGRDFHDTGPPIPNFKRASMALTQLGIRKPPVKNQYPGRSGFEVDEVETWKIWYEQVRDGSRTFSFEGDDAIYSLKGRTTVEKDGPMRSRPDRKLPSPDMEERDKGSSSIGRTPVMIAVLLVIGIVFFTIQQMRKRTAR